MINKNIKRYVILKNNKKTSFYMKVGVFLTIVKRLFYRIISILPSSPLNLLLSLDLTRLMMISAKFLFILFFALNFSSFFLGSLL